MFIKESVLGLIKYNFDPNGIYSFIKNDFDQTRNYILRLEKREGFKYLKIKSEE